MAALTPYPITPIGSFIGCILALLPLLSHVRKFSLAIWGFALWTFLGDFMMFVNTIIWHDNVNNVAPFWCDIATKLQIGVNNGITVCSLAISIRLYKVTRLRGSADSQEERRKRVTYELLLIVGFPVLMMALEIIVQPVRFQIVEELGCLGVEYSHLVYVIDYAPKLLNSLVCVILALFTLRAFMLHRKEMDQYLTSGQGITHNKYRRLIAIAFLDTVVHLPVVITGIAVNITSGESSALNYPYISWKNVHEGFGGHLPGASLASVIQTPASEWKSSFNVKWDEWISVVTAIIFFCVFGTTPEMQHYYRLAFWFIPNRLGYKRRRVETETISDVVFNSSPGQREGTRPTSAGFGRLSFLETTLGSNISTGSPVNVTTGNVHIAEETTRSKVE